MGHAQTAINYTLLTCALIGLYFTTRVNYLLFHALAEFFSIAVASCVFMVAWHSRGYIRNPYLFFIGVAYLFIAFLDLLHTLAYKGMPIFTDYDFYANQLWIGARYMESLSLLIGFLYLLWRRLPNPYWLLGIYFTLTALLVLSIFVWKIFPECFIAGAGLTPFKKISEYIICTILVASMGVLWRSRHRFDSQVFRVLLFSISCTIVSELAFTFYVSNYGLSNLVGHYFKIFSFMGVYQALVHTGIERPYQTIFRELNLANRSLVEEVEARKNSEAQREELIADLRKALDEIKTLHGVIPICSSCKKVRDDKGYWNQVEAYIRDHSDATFTHSLCPECFDRYEKEIPEGTE